jgi:hypothetical protein
MRVDSGSGASQKSEKPSGLLAPGEAERAASDWLVVALRYEDDSSRVLEEETEESVLEKLVRQSEMRLNAAKARAAASAIRTGNFSFHSAGPTKAALPGTLLMRAGPYSLASGKGVEIATTIEFKEAGVAIASRELVTFQEAADDEYIGMFNNLLYEERVSRRKKHLAASEQIGLLRKNRKMKRVSKSREVDRLSEDLIPARYTVDEGFMMRRRKH